MLADSRSVVVVESNISGQFARYLRAETGIQADALVLKYLQDAGGVLSFALRAPTNQQLMETETVSKEYLADRYQKRNSEHGGMHL